MVDLEKHVHTHFSSFTVQIGVFFENLRTIKEPPMHVINFTLPRDKLGD
jgi:hypothetical protein